jgi:hypothetical protein
MIKFQISESLKCISDFFQIFCILVCLRVNGLRFSLLIIFGSSEKAFILFQVQDSETPSSQLPLQVSRMPSAVTVIFYFFLNINTKISCTALHSRLIAVDIPRSYRYLEALGLLTEGGTVQLKAN